jgi:hypothetical protein
MVFNILARTGTALVLVAGAGVFAAGPAAAVGVGDKCFYNAGFAATAGSTIEGTNYYICETPFMEIPEAIEVYRVTATGEVEVAIGRGTATYTCQGTSILEEYEAGGEYQYYYCD